MVVAIIVCVLVVWVALALLVALLFGRAVKMADIKHRDAIIFSELTSGSRGRREVVPSR